MLHDPQALAHVARRMRAPARPWDVLDAPDLPELIRRVDAEVAARAARPR